MAGTPPPPPKFWRKVPVDPAYDHWLTIGVERKVLVVVRTVTTLTRLLDILSLFEGDHRIQVVFTFDEDRPGILGAGVSDALRAFKGEVLSWEEATKRQFHLAIAASENDALHELDAPVLLVPHGIGYQKYYPGSLITSGMDPARLIHHGDVVASSIALSHSVQREQLRAACPDAVGRAAVVGDPCHDRMLVSKHRAPRYRAALGTGERVLVVLASTWGRGSLFGLHPELPRRLLEELPLDDYQLAISLHPGVWAAHGHWQIESWLAPELRAGLVLVPPDHGWQATILAADCVVSDEGSAALYAAAVDKPLLLATAASATTVAESPLAALVRSAPALQIGQPFRAQLDSAVAQHQPGTYEAVVKQAVEDPGSCARLLGGLLYDSLELSPRPTRFPPVPDPTPILAPVSAFVAGLDDAGQLVRFPATASPSGLRFRHVVAHAEDAELHELDGAAIVYTEDETRLGEILGRWPAARLAAAPTSEGCWIALQDGTTSFLPTDGSDVLRLASLAYTKLIATPRR